MSNPPYNHTPPNQLSILAAEGIADHEQDLSQMSAAELQALFGFAKSSRINATRVIKNLIWQTYSKY